MAGQLAHFWIVFSVATGLIAEMLLVLFFICSDRQNIVENKD